MKTKNPKFKMNKSKIVNVKSFWKGSIMSDLNFKDELINTYQSELNKDFFSMYSGDELKSQIQDAIDYLDNNELFFSNEYSINKSYTIETKDMVTNMLLINELVKRGIRKNDNDYGLMIMIS